MMNFTKRLFFGLVLMLVVAQVNAQFTFTVTEPSSIAGEYVNAAAGFGGSSCDLTEDIVAPMVFVVDSTSPESDGCEPTDQDLTGKIAFVDRGACAFTQKVLNCQNAGAVAVVICNNNNDAIFGPGGSDDAITIFATMISKDDCAKIRVDIDGAMGKLSPTFSQVREDNRTIFWSDDFNDGMEGWSVANRNEEGDDFIWSEDGTFTSFGGGSRSMALDGSTCTAAVGFPSGWYQGNRTGIPDSIGSSYIAYDADLISPTIDLSEVTTGVAVEFDQSIQRLNGIGSGRNIFSRLFYSIDNGETWSAGVVINPDLPVNSSDVTTPPIHTTERVALPGVEGQSQVKIKFNWTCDFYYWIIDNVKLVEREDNNIGITDFFAVTPDAQIPVNQTYPINFLIELENVGSKPQNNVNVNVSIKKDGQEVFTADNDYGTVEADTAISFQVFTEAFTPTDLGVYTGVYSVTSDEEDFDTSNNTSDEFTFEVTEHTFAKERGRTQSLSPNSSNWDDPAAAHSWAIGNVYHINDNANSNGDAYAVASVDVGVTNPGDLEGQSILVILYKWEDDGDANMEVGEYTSIASAEYEFTGDEEAQGLINIVLEDDNDNDFVNLDENSTYVVMVQYTDPIKGSDEDELQIESSNEYNRFAQSVLNAGEEAEIGTRLFGLGIGETRLAYLLALQLDENTAFNELDYNLNDFGSTVSPIIRMNVKTEAEITGLKDVLAAENIISIHPNPTQDVLNVSIDLKETVNTATLNVVDVTGKVVMTRSYSNVKEGNFILNTSALANGVYNLNVITDNGFRASKFIIQK